MDKSNIIVSTTIPSHNIFQFDDVIFSSNFDNGNLAKVEKVNNHTSYINEFKIWTAPDNYGSQHQSKHCAWYYFTVTGIRQNTTLKIQLVNASYHSGLYRYDMRPVYKSISTNNKWCRLKTTMHPMQDENRNNSNSGSSSNTHLYFEHVVEALNDTISFAFTYPYTYNMVQDDCKVIDKHVNNMNEIHSIYCQRELLITTPDKLRLDLITITSVDGASIDEREELLSDLFPESTRQSRPPVFPKKEILFISARVHPGEVPAQHTLKGIINLLLDPVDLCAKELRAKYVFKIIPILNPDGVYRGHFRMDEYGQNLNRYYIEPNLQYQPTIFAAKKILDLYAKMEKLCFYLDLHAHASKRGCFIYGNVLDRVEHQVQNQLYCKLISLNTAHFDYSGCLFSKDHMTRIDPGDQAKGLTAEGSGRVSTYLQHGIIHSYTLECNYNCSKYGNEVAPCDSDPLGSTNQTPSSIYTANPEPYSPGLYNGVGRACLIAFLDIRGHNPCPRISKSTYKHIEKIRMAVSDEVRNKKEFKGQIPSKESKKLQLSNGKLLWHRCVSVSPVTQSSSGSSSGSSRTDDDSSVASSANTGRSNGMRIGKRDLLPSSRAYHSSVSAAGRNPSIKGTQNHAAINNFLFESRDIALRGNSTHSYTATASGDGSVVINQQSQQQRVAYPIRSPTLDFDSNKGGARLKHPAPAVRKNRVKDNVQSYIYRKLGSDTTTSVGDIGMGGSGAIVTLLIESSKRPLPLPLPPIVRKTILPATASTKA